MTYARLSLSQNIILLMQLEQFDPDLDTRWLQLRIEGTKIARRTNHSATIHNHSLFIYGGYDVQLGILGDFDQLQLNYGIYRWLPVRTPLENRPGNRRSHTLRTVGEQLLMFGGQVNATESTNKLHIFDMQSRTWQQPQTLPIPPIDSHECIIYKHKMLILGGYHPQTATYNDTPYQYNPSTSRLSRLMTHGRKPIGRSNFSAALVESRVIMFGGLNVVNLNDMWSLDLEEKTWTEVVSGETLWPEPRRGHSMVGYSGHLFLFGGIQNITHEKNDLYLFSLDKLSWCKLQSNSNQVTKHRPQHFLTQQPTPTHPPTHKKSHTHTQLSSTSRHCRFNLTLNSFKGIPKTVPLYAKTSLYRRRNDTELFSSVVRSRKSVFEENKRRSFLERKDRMLRELEEGASGWASRGKLSPVSEAMKYSLGVVGVNKSTPKSHRRVVKVPMVRFDQTRNCMLGKKPCARDGQTAVVYENSLLIFGGDRHMMSFHDVYFFRMDQALRLLKTTHDQPLR